MGRELITKYLCGEASEAEVNELYNQVSKNPSIRKEFARLKNIWVKSGISSELSGQQLDEEYAILRNKFNKGTEQKSRSLVWLRRIAAVLIIPLTVGATLLVKDLARKEHVITYSELFVPVGEKSQLILPDGSSVWLNSQSTLKYSNGFGQETRTVSLTGEALFEVKPDSRVPFIVETESMDIQVTGTKFNVTAYPEDVEMETTLINGRVTIGMNKEKTGLTNEIIMKPDQKVVFKKEQKTIHLENVNSTLSSSWIQGEYIFQNEPFINITKRIERWYNIEIVFVDDELKNQRLSGRFKDNEHIEQILEVLKLTTPIKITLKGNDLIQIDKTGELISN